MIKKINILQIFTQTTKCEDGCFIMSMNVTLAPDPVAAHTSVAQQLLSGLGRFKQFYIVNTTML